MEALNLKSIRQHWHNDWTVEWDEAPGSFGIVARELLDIDQGGSRILGSRDRRSPEAIRTAFHRFLDEMESRNVSAAHVQLLSAGGGRVFQPWVSLVQMARAYGDWCRSRVSQSARNLLQVKIYVVDSGVLAMLQGGHIDLVEQIENTALRINIVTMYGSGHIERHHQIVSGDEEVGAVVGSAAGDPQPWISVHPTPTRKAEALPLGQVQAKSLRECGLVAGSTLYVDYRERSDPLRPR